MRTEYFLNRRIFCLFLFMHGGTSMTGKQITEMQTKYVLQSWSKQRGLNPLAISKAEGIYYYDFEGNRYTDMASQLVNLNVGFGNKEIVDAIKKQADQYCYLSPHFMLIYKFSKW